MTHQDAPPVCLKAAVLTISDTRTPDTDKSGQYLLQALETAGHQVIAYQIVQDDEQQIRQALQHMHQQANLILTTGGTGISGRDVTVGIISEFLTKPLPGFGELFRMLSYQEVGAAAMFSRAIGGLADETFIFALPGSLNAVQLGWEKLLSRQMSHLWFEAQR